MNKRDLINDPTWLDYRRSLFASISEVMIWWTQNHPGKRLEPESLTGLCGRRFPINRKGQTVINADEQLWARGRLTKGIVK